MVVFALILIALLSTISASVLAVTQQATTPKDKADTLIVLLEKANSTIAEAFQRLKAKNIDIPQESSNQYKQAAALAEEAMTLYETGNYSEANNKIIQALQKLKQAILTISETTVIEQTQEEVNHERTMELTNSIDRLTEQMIQLQDLAFSAQSAGLKPPSIDAKIVAVKSLMANVYKSLNQGNLDQATTAYNEARTLIDELTRGLSSLAENLSTQRMETYIAETENRLGVIKQEAQTTLNAASLTAVNQAETNLSLAKTYLHKQLLNQTVAALVDSKASEEVATEALKPAPTSSRVPGNNSPTAVTSP